MRVDQLLKEIPRSPKIKRSEYKSEGLYPVIDQSKAYISGYTDDPSKLYRGSLPVIVFGDHTRALKLVNFPFCIGADGTQLLQPTGDIDTKYFYYALQNIKLTNYGYERHFKYLKESEINILPALEQQKISAVLSAYDDLIEVNQKRITILEKMIHEIFKEWFYLYRFPGFEKHKFSKGIPIGWKLKKIPDVININPQITLQKSGYKPFVPMSSLSNDSMLISDIESREGNSGAKFQNGDTLFARITPCLENGKTGYVQFLKKSTDIAFGSTEFIVLRSIALSPEFVYCLARRDEFRRIAISSMTGASGRQRVQEQCFSSLDILLPPENLIEKFSSVASLNFKLIYRLQKNNEILRKTRELLLPKLVNGLIKLEAC